jgi:hypothetical protein
VKHALPTSATTAKTDRRAWDRRPLDVPGLLTWRDARGTTRFASIVARNVSDFGAFVECDTLASIPLYRLVTLQLDAGAARKASVRGELATDKVLAAVYRAVPARPDGRTRPGYALRLLIEPQSPGQEASNDLAATRAVRSIA